MRASEYSVVIPARDAAAFIADALRSVSTQSVLPREIIVVDDASRDDTAAIAEASGATVIAHAAPRGPAAARNAGVWRAATPVVAFLDADDEWAPDHACRILRALDNTGAVFASSAVELFGSASGITTADLPDGTLIELGNTLLIDNPIVQSGTVVRKAAFESVGGYDESVPLAEDYDLWMRMSDVGGFAYLRSPTVRRRLHTAQITHRRDAALLRCAWTARRAMVQRRLPTMTPAQRTEMQRSLHIAAERDVANAIWAGDHDAMRTLRSELRLTDAILSPSERLGDLAGVDLLPRRMLQDLHCSGRRVINGLRRL